jgi:hypothetical protein
VIARLSPKRYLLIAWQITCSSSTSWYFLAVFRRLSAFPARRDGDAAVIASRTGAIPEIIHDRENGMLVTRARRRKSPAPSWN